MIERKKVKYDACHTLIFLFNTYSYTYFLISIISIGRRVFPGFRARTNTVFFFYFNRLKFPGIFLGIDGFSRGQILSLGFLLDF